MSINNRLEKLEKAIVQPNNNALTRDDWTGEELMAYWIAYPDVSEELKEKYINTDWTVPSRRNVKLEDYFK